MSATLIIDSLSSNIEPRTDFSASKLCGGILVTSGILNKVGLRNLLRRGRGCNKLVLTRRMKLVTLGVDVFLT